LRPEFVKEQSCYGFCYGPLQAGRRLFGPLQAGHFCFQRRHKLMHRLVDLLRVGLCVSPSLLFGNFFSGPRQAALETPVYFGALSALTRRRGAGTLGAREDRRLKNKNDGR